ncbi:MAG TPA: MarR family winged helix-turn-helix transcriptional regulator [Candidatus Nitrosotalea sp.]|nr:MarR family winged helix-turn-helix transcriptional regulator [Candidatus Nitrosotalea sp.]
MARVKDGRAMHGGDEAIDPRLLREISGCTCLQFRRISRRMTQIYDRHLAAGDITSNQFGLLTYLQAAATPGIRAATASGGLSIGQLAERIGMDPTTLNRNLKPLLAAKLVRDAVDGADARIRQILITERGRQRLSQAIPLWRKAQAEVTQALGGDIAQSLNGLLETTVAALAEL